MHLFAQDLISYNALQRRRRVSKASNVICIAFLAIASLAFSYTLGMATVAHNVNAETCNLLPPDDLGHAFYFCEDIDGNVAFRPVIAA